MAVGVAVAAKVAANRVKHTKSQSLHPGRNQERQPVRRPLMGEQQFAILMLANDFCHLYWNHCSLCLVFLEAVRSFVFVCLFFE